MKHYKIFKPLLFIVAFLFSGACKQQETVWKGQAPIKKESTLTRPIQYQLKKTYDLGNGIYFSNEFEGARLNGIAMSGKNEVTALITPENTPINSSPWYAFKVWSETKKGVQLKITYNEGVSHRYFPKLSNDRKHWHPADSLSYFPDTASIEKGKIQNFVQLIFL